MTARFAEMQGNDGFDSSAVPAWQMVPLNGSKTVKLLDGQGLSVTSLNPAFATVDEVQKCFVDGHREFRVTGQRVGVTTIEARHGAQLRARLEIAVKRKKVVTVAFNFVRDNAGHQTSRSSANVDSWVRTMNGIFLPQINVEIQKKSTRTVRVNKDLGTVVRFSSHLSGVAASEHEWDDVTALRDSSADFNFFFVWEYEQDATPGTDNTDAGALGGNCLFEDAAGTEIAETMAHETGHYLGERDYYATADRPLLMYGYTDSRGRKIPKAHANTMNP